MKNLIQSNDVVNKGKTYKNLDFGLLTKLKKPVEARPSLNFGELSLMFLVLHIIRVNTVSPQWVPEYFGYNRSLSQDGKLILTKKDITNYVRSQGFEIGDDFFNYILLFAQINNLIDVKIEKTGDHINSEIYSWNMV